jgi:hypothetical protein
MTLTWECYFVGSSLLQQQPVLAVKQEDTECSMQPALWLRPLKAMAVPLAGMPWTHQDKQMGWTQRSGRQALCATFTTNLHENNSTSSRETTLPS